jgi:hypothetical protein
MKLRKLVPLLTVLFLMWTVPASVQAGSLQETQDKKSAEQKEAQADQKEAQKEEKDEGPKTEAEKATQQELEKKACQSLDVHYKTETDKTQHPTPEQPADKALIYVVRPTMFGNKVQTKLAVDGQFKGVNRGNNYFFFTLDPGEHYFCSQAENKSVLAMTVEAGKTYYVQQQIKMGFMKARTKLVAMNAEEGQKALAKCHPSSWEEKK